MAISTPNNSERGLFYLGKCNARSKLDCITLAKAMQDQNENTSPWPMYCKIEMSLLQLYQGEASSGRRLLWIRCGDAISQWEGMKANGDIIPHIDIVWWTQNFAHWGAKSHLMAARQGLSNRRISYLRHNDQEFLGGILTTKKNESYT